MPQRMLRDWTNSSKVDQLTPFEEVVFARLIMKVDDYGRYYADATMLRNTLFPRKNNIPVEDIRKAIEKMAEVGLIHLYESAKNGEPLLEILDFGQRLRQMKNRFDAPTATCQQVDSNLSASCRPEEKRREEEEEEEGNTPKGVTDLKQIRETCYPFEDFWNDYGKKVGRKKTEPKYEKIKEADRLQIKLHIPKYKEAQPDPQFRKDPYSYLHNQTWTDELIYTSHNHNGQRSRKSPTTNWSNFATGTPPVTG